MASSVNGKTSKKRMGKRHGVPFLEVLLFTDDVTAKRSCCVKTFTFAPSESEYFTGDTPN